MKKWIGTGLMFLLFTAVQAQDDAIVKFFSKHMENDNFSRVYISPKMMQMAGGFLKSEADVKESDGKDLGELMQKKIHLSNQHMHSQSDGKDLGELMQKIRGIRILSGENVNGKGLYQEAMSTLTKNKYEDLMDMQDKDQSLKFMVREEKGLITELLMISGSETDFTLLSMLGNFTYQDLNLLAEKTNLPGMNEYQSGKNKE